MSRQVVYVDDALGAFIWDNPGLSAYKGTCTWTVGASGVGHYVFSSPPSGVYASVRTYLEGLLDDDDPSNDNTGWLVEELVGNPTTMYWSTNVLDWVT